MAGCRSAGERREPTRHRGWIAEKWGSRAARSGERVDDGTREIQRFPLVRTVAAGTRTARARR